MNSTIPVLGLMFFGVAMLGKNGQALALLKPTSGAMQTLQARALEVDTQIDGAWSHTTTTAIYRRAGRQQIEADFVMTVPEGAVVTGFSYWYGREKVTARLTQRERAREISDATEGGEVDPLWAKMIGKNVFRARLHAVKPKRDLRVEIKMAQPLQNEGNANVWSYPLQSETRDVTLDWLRVRVGLKSGFASQNNLGAQVSGDEILVRKTHFKPKTDARISISHDSAALQTQLSTQHMTGANGATSDEGFFALAVQSPAPLNDLPKIEGFETLEILPMERISASEVRILGRYRGKGAATISWGNQKASLWFAPNTNALNELPLAAPLWGAARIEALSELKNTRAQIVALSKQFGVSSKWTSWIAIPAKQRALIDERLRRLDMNRRGANLSRVWAMEIENQRPLGEAALQARASLRALGRSSAGRKYGFDEENARENAIEIRLSELARLVMAARMGIVAPNRETNRKMANLAAYAQTDSHSYLEDAQGDLRQRQVETVAGKWQREVLALRGNGKVAKKLQTQLSALQNRYGMSDDYATSTYKNAAQQMAYAILNEAFAGREDQPRAAVLIDAGERFARRCGQKSFRRNFYEPAIQAHLNKVRQTLLSEIETGRDQSQSARDAQNRLRLIYSIAPQLRGSLREANSTEAQIDAARRGLAGETAYRLVQTRAEHPSDSKTLRELENQLNRVSSGTEQEAEDFLSEQTKRFNSGQPLVTAHQFRLLENGIQPSDENEYSAPTRSEPRIQNRETDPLLSLELPRDVRLAEVILPSGETQKLRWNEQANRFETRFFAPRMIKGNRTVLGIRAVKTSGATTRWNLNLAFDAQTAQTQGLKLSENAPTQWILGLWSNSPTQSVSALLPWSQRIALPALKSGQFVAQLEAPPIWRGKKARVEFVVKEKSGKPSRLAVDWN